MEEAQKLFFYCFALLFCSSVNSVLWTSIGISEIDYEKEIYVSSVRSINTEETGFSTTPLSVNSTPLVDKNLEYEKNDTCIRDLQYIGRNMKKEWAQRMFDSTSYPVLNEESWRSYWPGNLDYCGTVIVPYENDPLTVRFRGMYCYIGRFAKLEGGAEIFVMSDLCLPDTCKAENILSSRKTRSLLKPWLSEVAVGLNVSIVQAACRNLDSKFNNGAIFMICLLGFFVLLVVAGTSITIAERYTNSYANIIDSPVIIKTPEGLSIDTESVLNNRRSSERTSLLREENGVADKVIKFLKCFCAVTNISKVMSVQQVKEREPLLCLHGLRFISMTWIVLIHTYNHSFGMVDPDELRKSMYMMNTLAFKGVMGAAFGVDTFFLLSGFLVTHIFLKEAAAKEGKIPWWYFYFHRYWRLTPVYAVVLGFNTALLPFLYEPFMVTREPMCAWWSNLLYLNNIVKFGKICMSWTWYLANDMQFYVISPVFLYPLWRWPKIGASIIVAMLISSIIANGVITYQYDLIPGYAQLSEATNFTVYATQTTDYYLNIYNKPYTRIQPYLIGALLAYMLFTQRDQKFVLRPCAQFVGWSIAFTLAITTMYAIHGTHPDLTARCFYNALRHTCWGLAVAWVIYACLSGFGGVVNWILTYDAFLPLSRLTYCAYLVHPIYLTVYYETMRTPFYLTNMEMVTHFFSFFLVGYVGALTANILVEAPFMALEKLMIKK